MSATTIREAAFLNRFQSVWSRKRRTQLWQVLASSLLLAVAGFGLIAMADYAWELNRSIRATLLISVAVGVVAYFVRSLWQTLTHTGRPATASEIEQAFPELGQAVRTTVQFGEMPAEEYKNDGVASSLVAAMAAQTHQRALPLTIEDVIPVKRLWLLAGIAVGFATLLFGASSLDWEWRSAAQRAALADTSYRDLEVQPGHLTIDEGAGTQIEIDLIGRTNRKVVLMTRLADEANAEWTERTLEELKPSNTEQSSKGTASRPRAEFIAKLDRIVKPVEYRVVAGELASATYLIDVRRPLAIEALKIDLTPPAYTGQEKTTFLDGNLSALEGTVAVFDVTFDKPVKSASIVLAPRRTPIDDEDKNLPIELPLRERTAESSSGGSSAAALNTFTTSLALVEDRNYTIVAEARDGTKLAETKYRIRVRQDQPPQVSFESPGDSIEVHSLAELLMRIRVRDDYGLSQAGVVFQVNNEQTVPLIAEEFATVVAAANEFTATGKVSPTTQTALEKALPLELFELTQKDSVMYFGYAEDNRPDNPQRTETDMRFIDIRPFKRSYKMIDPDPMPSMGGGSLKTLEELITQQRFGLNRTMQIEKRAAAGRNPDASTLDQLMKFETDLAQNVRESAEGLLARGFDSVDLFFQAETAMLAAVDSMSVGKWENATLQMKDALKFLIEQRDLAALFILKNPDAAQLAAMRAYDRLQAQKLRRPKTDKEEARELIQRLEALIAEESSVAESLDAEPEETRESKGDTQ